MLELKKKKLLGCVFAAEVNGEEVGALHRSRWHPKATITLGEKQWNLARRGFLKTTYTLAENGEPVAEATQASVFRCRLMFRFGDRDFEVRKGSWSRTLFIESGGSDIGTVAPRGPFSSGAVVDLPDSLPIAVQIFIGWIALVRWDAAAVAATG